jgi:hypothetical protein
MYQYISNHQTLMFAVVPIGLIIFMVLIGWLSRRINHSPKTIGPAVLEPAFCKANPGEPVVLHNIIVNVRWPINN